jgi:TonB family protein
MKKTLFISILISLLCLLLNGQDIIEKEFYKSRYDKKPTKEKNAEIVQFKIKENDNVVCYEKHDLQTNRLLELQRYKNEIPYGKWKYYSEDTNEYFELNYNTTNWVGIIQFDLNDKKIIGDSIYGFKGPEFPENGNSFRRFISSNLRYPEEAAVNNLKGRVILKFILDENGEITNLSIAETAHPVLDKEAERVVLSSPNWIPAKINNHPVKVFIEFPINFVLR